MVDKEQGTNTSLPYPWRKTPLVYSKNLSKYAGCEIYLKLETLQPSGSFKSRGVGNFIRAHLLSQQQQQQQQKTQHHGNKKNDINDSASHSKSHFYISSGGNAGLGCVHAATLLGAPATIVVPESCSPYMMNKIRAAGAHEIIQFGASWAECDTHLREEIIPQATATGQIAVYVPPFDAQEVWDGNATLVEEVFEQMATDEQGRPDALVCSVGGGGLFSGIMQGLSAVGYPGTRVVAVETKGADSLAFSLQQGRLATLPGITSIATSLGARRVAAQAFEYAQREEVVSVVLGDGDAKEACVRFADEERVMVEAACGVCLALCYKGMLRGLVSGLTEKSRVVVVLCGGSNISTDVLYTWLKELK